MDHLRAGIHLRAYGQKNPKQEYKREAFQLFQDMLSNLKVEVVRFLSHVQVQKPEDVEAMEAERRERESKQKIALEHAEASGLMPEGVENTDRADEPRQGDQGEATPFVRDGKKVGRNEPCPCGSGKKYKQCHGKLS